MSAFYAALPPQLSFGAFRRAEATLILVTGGAGFIGSHTVRTLLEEGYCVRVLDDLSTGSREALHGCEVELVVGSITDRDAVDQAMQGVSRVVHLAARISVPDSLVDPVGYDETNVRGFLHILEGARRHQIDRVVYASSCAVYGSVPGLPKPESAPIQPESPYAAAKAANEMYAKAYTASLDVSCVGLRYFNVFGPGQSPDGPYGAVIPTFVDRAIRGEPLLIHGDGEQGRDFVSVRDVARANLCAVVSATGSGEVFNVGGGRMMTINELAASVCRQVPGTVDVVHQAPRPGDIRASQADISRARATLGWWPQADFQAALDETVDSFRVHAMT